MTAWMLIGVGWTLILPARIAHDVGRLRLAIILGALAAGLIFGGSALGLFPNLELLLWWPPFGGGGTDWGGS